MICTSLVVRFLLHPKTVKYIMINCAHLISVCLLVLVCVSTCVFKAQVETL